MPIGRRRTLKMECSAAGGHIMLFTEPEVVTFLQTLDTLHGAVPLARFHYVQDPTDPLVYTYRLDAADGRRWDQTLRFDSNVPGQTFDVDDFWREPEFVPHRAVRTAIIALTITRGLIEADIKWEI